MQELSSFICKHNCIFTVSHSATPHITDAVTALVSPEDVETFLNKIQVCWLDAAAFFVRQCLASALNFNTGHKIVRRHIRLFTSSF